jgi:hypothetical protein
MMLIKANKIKNIEMIKMIMDDLIAINEYLDYIGESNQRYEDICSNVQEQFNEILESMNIQLMKITNTNMDITSIMLAIMWDYLRKEIEFDDLINRLKAEYSKRDI